METSPWLSFWQGSLKVTFFLPAGTNSSNHSQRFPAPLPSLGRRGVGLSPALRLHKTGCSQPSLQRSHLVRAAVAHLIYSNLISLLVKKIKKKEKIKRKNKEREKRGKGEKGEKKWEERVKKEKRKEKMGSGQALA